jgi:hypothetical protein
MKELIDIRRKVIRMKASSLRIHPTAQRKINKGKLADIIANLNLNAIGVLNAVEVTIKGIHGIYVVNGQHRLRALLDTGHEEYSVDVMVHLDVQTPAEASALFLILNKVASVAPYDKYVQAVLSEDGIALAVERCLASHGLHAAQSTADSALVCTSTLLKMQEFDNGKSLDLTLATIKAAWGTKAAGFEGKIVEGIGLLYFTFNGQIDKPSLIKKLAKYAGGPSALLGDAKGRTLIQKRSLGRSVTDQIIDIYNQHRKAGRLDPL